MHYSTLLSIAMIGSAAAQSLKIPTRSGSIISLPKPSVITGLKDMGNKEFDRGRKCDSDEDVVIPCSIWAVFGVLTLRILDRLRLRRLHPRERRHSPERHHRC